MRWLIEKGDKGGVYYPKYALEFLSFPYFPPVLPFLKGKSNPHPQKKIVSALRANNISNKQITYLPTIPPGFNFLSAPVYIMCLCFGLSVFAFSVCACV